MHNDENVVKSYPPGRMGSDCSDYYGLTSTNPAAANYAADYQRQGTSGFVMVLPYLEQKQIYDWIGFQLGAIAPANCGLGPSTANWYQLIPNYDRLFRTRPQKTPGLRVPKFNRRTPLSERYPGIFHRKLRALFRLDRS